MVLSAEEYRRLTSGRGSLIEFLQSSPWADMELDLQGMHDTGRDVEL